MRILQRNLTHTTDTFLFISHTTKVLLLKFCCNILIGVRIIKEMSGSVASGTQCIISSREYLKRCFLILRCEECLTSLFSYSLYVIAVTYLPFVLFIQSSRSISDSLVEAHPLWEYPCEALSQPFSVLDFNFTKTIEDTVVKEGNINCEG